ncbi:TerD family protein [Rhodococcus baikonurensis]|uniref:TerD family protein n=1 Tax=Rhodococcus baikonurensis TaxID=172041 RepID=A0ABV5XE76_9NOCA
MVVFFPGGGSKAASDQDSVFYSNTVDEDGAVKLSVGSASDSGPSVRVDFDALPAGRQLAVPAAAVDGDNSFGDLGAVSVGLESRRKTCHLCTRPRDCRTNDGSCRSIRRADVWRRRAAGQGHNHGLGAIAVPVTVSRWATDLDFVSLKSEVRSSRIAASAGQPKRLGARRITAMLK